MSKLFRIFGFLAILLPAAAISVPASADWHGGGGRHGGDWHHDHFHSHVFFGFGGFFPPAPFYDPFYYPYPAYYPPVAYYPPAYASPAPAVVAPQVNCMRFNGDATIDDNGQPFFGTACLQSDGRWHIVGGN